MMLSPSRGPVGVGVSAGNGVMRDGSVGVGIGVAVGVGELHDEITITNNIASTTPTRVVIHFCFIRLPNLKMVLE
jgi:hypothetical protein